MHTYCCFLRGINVSGKNKIIMKEFKVKLESWGFKNVTTYIQSGNIVFSSLNDALLCQQQIKEGVLKAYKYDIEVLVVKPLELKNLVESSPFLSKEESKNIYFTLLKSTPTQEKYIELTEYNFRPGELAINNQMIYLYCPNGYGKSKINNNYIEKKLGISATTRNLKTMLKMIELSV